ncbi:MAG: 4-hydroxy-tetrahydrodipicolinate reductase [bacterium]
MLDLCLVGGLGRMGKALASMAEADSGLRIVSVWETAYAVGEAGDYSRATGYSKNQVLVTASGADAVEPCRVVVDFSLPQAFPEVVRVCEDLARPLVTGTTGIEGKSAALAGLARKAAVVCAPSMAAGMATMVHLVESAAGEVGRSADIEIVEAHHRGKKDVPSGTALELARLIGARAGKHVVVGRAQGPAARADELVIHSLRVGDVPGTHTVVFSLRGETLEITHTAQSRDCFAAGALRAARFAAEAGPGLYGMSDVLAAG